MRCALWVDVDLSDFHRRFRRDRLVGPLIRRMPGFRPGGRPWPWEALAAAVVGQLIEARQAALIERRIAGRWGAAAGGGAGGAARRPRPGGDRRPRPGRNGADGAGRQAGAWRCGGWPATSPPAAAGSRAPRPTGGCWRCRRSAPGRCSASASSAATNSTRFPPGTSATSSSSAASAGGGRRATIPEVEEFYAPYEPYRGPGRGADPLRPPPAGRPGPADAPRRLSQRHPAHRSRPPASVADEREGCASLPTGTGPSTR